MKSLKSKLSKLAVFAFIGAFSFGLAISCVSNHKQNINKVFAADDISTRWEYNSNNKALTCTYASNYPNGFIMETNQVGVRGVGNGQYELAYQVLGYPSNSVQPEYTDYGIFTVVFISGSYNSTASNDGPYGSITAYPLDVSGLDSDTEYEIYLKVEPSGDMNEQGSGEGNDENAGSWTWNENTMTLSFQFNDTAAAGYVSTTTQTMVYGHGNGTFDIEYDLWGTPGNATVASNDLLATKMIRIYDGYYDENQDDPTASGATITGNPSAISGLESYGEITIKVDVEPSGTMNTDGWRVNDGDLYFYVLADVNPASIDSITWNNSSGNGTGEAILSVTISTNGGSFQQVYQINNPTFYPELEGTSGTTSGNTTVEGISEWSDRPVTLDISYKTYSLGESTQAEITSLELLENPPTYYYVDDVIDFSNIILVANYSDGSTKQVTSNEYVAYFSPEGECDPYQPLVSGDYMLYFSYEGATTERGVPIYVNEREPETQAEITSLELLENPPTYYYVDDVIDFSNIILVANYSDGSTKEVYSNEYVAYFSPEGERDPYQPLVSGDYMLYFSYEGVTTESGVPIYVNDREPESYEFEIIFEANNGTGETRTNSFTHSESSYTYDLPSIEQIGFTREGYSFVGWSYYSDGEVLKEAPVIEGGRTTTFYAIWESTAPQGTEYIVKFDGNGATSGSMDDDSFRITWEEYQYSFPYELPECGYSREGYAFAGWGLTETALLKWQPGETKDIEPGETTFFAIWAEQFTITFEANGGLGYMEPITVASGVRHTVPGCDFTREGYSFVCWAVNSPTSSTTVNPDDSVTVSQNYVLYAVWEEISSGYTYSVIFNGNGATSGAMEPVTFTSNEYSYDYIFPECTFEREGYEFIGWSFTDEGLIKFKPGETRSITNGETTFFAIWAEQFTITFEANGGSGYMEPITVASGERRTVPGCDFTREGYSFVCWAVNSPTSSMTVNPDDSVSVSQNYVLYAVWEQDGPAQHEGMWYDEQSNRLRFYNTDLGEEQEVALEVFVLDFGPNTSLTRAELSAIIYYEDSIWETRSYEMRTFTIGEDSGRQFISGQLDLYDGEGQRAVKLYVESLYNNVMTPGLNYVEGYNQIFYVNDQYDSSVVEFENVEINEITREATLKGYAVDVTGETNLLEFTINLTNVSVNVDEMYGDGQILTGYWPEIKKTITLTVFNITYNSLEEDPISPETIEEINSGMDKVDLSDEQKQQINDKIDENSDRIGESTGNAISQALDGTTSLMSDNPEFAEKQKEVIVVVVETVIEVETNKGSDIGQAREVDSILPSNADLNVEQEIREFYELQMQELLGGEKQTRGITRASTPSYQIDVDISGIEDDKVIGHLDNEIALYGKMMGFIDNSITHMGEAALKIRQCSGEAVKVSVKNYVTKVKVSSFRDFDKEAADAEFVQNVYKAIMLHMQEQVINTLESEHKDSGNKDREAKYQEELAAVKDYETFEIMVTEVLRLKYVALTGDESYTDVEVFYNEIYWPLFEAWALDEDIPQELKDKGVNITLEELTTATIEQSTGKAKNFTIHSDLQNKEIVFLAAFGGGAIVAVSLAAIIPTIINKKRMKGVNK